MPLNLHPFLIFWFCTYFNGYFHKKCIQNSADMRYYQNLILIHCCLHKQSHIIWHITQNPYLIISIFSQSLRVIGIPASSSFWRKYPYICSTFWWHSNTILVLSPFRISFLDPYNTYLYWRWPDYSTHQNDCWKLSALEITFYQSVKLWVALPLILKQIFKAIFLKLLLHKIF